jgi:hypothetical protein
MKVHIVNLLIAIVVSALLTYGVLSVDSNSLKGATGFGSFISFAITLALAIGVSFENPRVGVNVKLVSTIFFVVSLCINLLFAFVAFSQTSYVIAVGLMFSLFVLIANSIYGARQ